MNLKLLVVLFVSLSGCVTLKQKRIDTYKEVIEELNHVKDKPCVSIRQYIEIRINYIKRMLRNME